MTAALQKLKKWFTRKGRPRPSPASLGPPPALLERYLQYKRLLGANSAILTTVADLQVKMDEGFLFDMYYVRQACDRLGHEIEVMVESLNAMSEGRYRASGRRPPAGGPSGGGRIGRTHLEAGSPGAAPG